MPPHSSCIGQEINPHYNTGRAAFPFLMQAQEPSLLCTASQKRVSLHSLDQKITSYSFAGDSISAGARGHLV